MIQTATCARCGELGLLSSYLFDDSADFFSFDGQRLILNSCRGIMDAVVVGASRISRLTPAKFCTVFNDVFRVGGVGFSMKVASVRVYSRPLLLAEVNENYEYFLDIMNDTDGKADWKMQNRDVAIVTADFSLDASGWYYSGRGDFEYGSDAAGNVYYVCDEGEGGAAIGAYVKSAELSDDDLPIYYVYDSYGVRGFMLLREYGVW